MGREDIIVECLRFHYWPVILKILRDDFHYIYTVGHDGATIPYRLIAEGEHIRLGEILTRAINDADSKSIVNDLFENHPRFSPIHLAAELGDITSLQLLINFCPAGRNLLQKKDRFGQTPIRLAAKAGKRDMVQKLISLAGYEMLFERGPDGKIPLDLGARPPRTYLNLSEIRRKLLVQEADLLQVYLSFEANSLVSLVLDIMKQQADLSLLRQ